MCKFQMKSVCLPILSFCVLSAACCGAPNAERSTQNAARETSWEQIKEESGVKGGLIVHLGCGDGKLTATLGAGDAYIVHGLDEDAKRVAAARAHIKSRGLYGKVSVDVLEGGALPESCRKACIRDE